MKKKGEIDIRKSAIKKVAKSGSQEIEKHTIAKRERGITLIALVVTIIIMLILAAVTLNMALGDNGLIQMAKFATNKYEQAAINESLAMQGLVNDLNNPWSVAPTTTTTPTEKPEGGGGGGGTTEEPKTASNLTEDNYGDYVNYGLDLSGDGNTTNDWRIFYVGENTKDGTTEKRIFLIAADYVPNTCDALIKAKTTGNANMITSTFSSEYSVCCSNWELETSATYHCYDNHNRNLNQTKTQCSFPEIFMPSGKFCATDNHYYCSDHVGMGDGGNVNSRCASSLQCTGNWKSFVVKNYADYAIGGPTVEMWIASWNQKYGNALQYANGHNEDSNSFGYSFGSDLSCTDTTASLKSTAGSNDSLYFPHNYDPEHPTDKSHVNLFNDSISDDAECDAYWLSSPSSNDYQRIY